MPDTSGSSQHDEVERANSALEQMTDRTSGNPQRVQAADVYALATSSRHEAGACDVLPNDGGIAPTTNRAKRVSFTVSRSC